MRDNALLAGAPAVDNLAPFNIDAEQALLGCVLEDNQASKLVDGLGAHHFGEPLHGRIWSAILEKVDAGIRVDLTALDELFSVDPAYLSLGGRSYLFDLYEKGPPPSSATALAEVIVDLALRRDLLGLGRLLVTASNDRTMSGYEHLGIAEKVILDLAQGAAPAENNLIDARSSVEATLAEMEHEAEHGRAKGLMTGLRCIDRRLRGLRPGHLLVIAGRPSMGKTALARQAAKGCAERNQKTTIAFFALEMNRRELDERMLSEISYRSGEWIAYQDMSDGKLTSLELRFLRDAAWKVPTNLVIDDTAILTVEYVRRRVWALKRKGPVGAVFIDYLQIMQRPLSNGRNDASVLGEMTAALKRLAREAGVCIVLLSQINRAVESRDDKRPQLSDLKESGAIEQDANAVLFTYREVYYVERAEPDKTTQKAKWEEWNTKVEVMKRRMDVLCAKNRQGSVGTDTQEYYAEFDAVSDVRVGEQ